MEGNINDIGIIHSDDTMNNMPYNFDEMKDGYIPTYNIEYFKNIQAENEKLTELIKKART